MPFLFFFLLWLLHTTRATVPGNNSLFQNPSWEGLHKLFQLQDSQISPEGSPFFLPHPPPLLQSSFNPSSCLNFLVFSAFLMKLCSPAQEEFLFCFVLLSLVPSAMTGNHHISSGIIHLPYSTVISINCALGLYFVSLEPTSPLFSWQSLANENLGFHIYFPWNELQQPILERLNTDSFVLGRLLPPSPWSKGCPCLQWMAAEITGTLKHIQ